MKRFLAVYLGSSSPDAMSKWASLDEKTRREKEKAGIEEWMNWATKNKNVIVENGSPLGKTKLINARGISDTKNLMTAYTVVQAESHEEAAKLFVNHPHFTIFPGEGVEIMECLPLPKM